MNARSFSILAATLFALIAVAQLVRALLGWPVTITGVTVPIWASWVAAAFAGGLSLLGFSAVRRN